MMGKQKLDDNSLMQHLLNLMRWDKPIGTWLLFWPCSWSIFLAAAQTNLSIMPTLNILALFFLGALIMRSAGCIINDLWDRKIDAKVERTKSRPLASGSLSIKQALTLLFFLLVSALIIVTQLKLEVFWLALISLPLVATYPLMKRITWWPQAFLGLTFNFGALMGWVAITGTISLPAIFLYISGILWTLGYDTIYAFQDIEDDIKSGIKSTARRLHSHARPAIAIFYIVSFMFYWLALAASDADIYVFIISLLPALTLSQQIIRLNINNQKTCANLFCANSFTGLLLVLPIIAKFLLN